MSRPLLLVVQPDPAGPLDRFEGWLTEAGLELQIIRPYAGEPVPTEMVADGLIVLGGDMDSWDDAGHPWLAHIRRLLRDAARRERPTLGICLGAQLLGLAHGGEVRRGAHGLEAGVAEVRRRPAAVDDPLLGALPETFVAATMHGDEITRLPPGAHWLADGATYPHQAFRIGSTSWGVQFHPEVSPSRYADWAADLQQGSAAADAVARRDPEVSRAGRTLARTFAALLTP